MRAFLDEGLKCEFPRPIRLIQLWVSPFAKKYPGPVYMIEMGRIRRPSKGKSNEKKV